MLELVCFGQLWKKILPQFMNILISTSLTLTIASLPEQPSEQSKQTSEQTPTARRESDLGRDAQEDLPTAEGPSTGAFAGTNIVSVEKCCSGNCCEANKAVANTAAETNGRETHTTIKFSSGTHV